MTCSRVTDSLPFLPKPGQTLATGAATSSAPSPISCQMTDATMGFVEENMQ